MLARTASAMPRRSQTARVTVSSEFRPGNSVLIWNVRVSPRFTRSCGSKRSDVVVAQRSARHGLQHAGHKIDQRRFARAIRSDQRIARALRKRELDILATISEPKLLFRPGVDNARARLSEVLMCRLRAQQFDNPPKMPFGKKSPRPPAASQSRNTSTAARCRRTGRARP